MDHWIFILGSNLLFRTYVIPYTTPVTASFTKLPINGLSYYHTVEFLKNISNSISFGKTLIIIHINQLRLYVTHRT
jgi:hypothetical protein